MVRLVILLNMIGGFLLSTVLPSLAKGRMTAASFGMLAAAMLPLVLAMIGLARGHAAHNEGRSHGAWSAYRIPAIGLTFYFGMFSLDASISIVRKVLQTWR